MAEDVPHRKGATTSLRREVCARWARIGLALFVFFGALTVRLDAQSDAGTITTLAGTGVSGFSGDGGLARSAQLDNPVAVAADGKGNLFIADEGNHRVRRIAPDGFISTVVGTGIRGSTPPSPFGAALLNSPRSVAVDSSGNLFIADSGNNRLIKRTPSGATSLFAGTGVEGFSGDGERARTAQLRNPWGVSVDGAGNVFIADTGNNRVRKVDAAGTITTIAGSGNYFGPFGDGGPALSASLSGPSGIAVDPEGNVFIADQGHNRVRKVTPAGVISTVAGPGYGGFSGDGGPATTASLSVPLGLAVDRIGNIFIADIQNDRIRMVTTAGTISTVAGSESGFIGDGGPAVSAMLSYAQGVAVDSAGNLFIADTRNHRIRRVNAVTGSLTQNITTVAGSGEQFSDGFSSRATNAFLGEPSAVVADEAGNFYVTDLVTHRVRKISVDGTMSTVAGDPSRLFSYQAGFRGDGGPATWARLNKPDGLAVDRGGSLYIADTHNHRIRKVTPDGIITTIVGNGIAGYGGDGELAVNAQLNLPRGLALDGLGNLYIADTFNDRVRKVTADGIIVTVAGGGNSVSIGDGGPAVSGVLAKPGGVALDPAGNLYIADTYHHRVRTVTLDGIIMTVAGIGVGGDGGDGQLALNAQLGFPEDVALDGSGNLYIADSLNSRIRKVTPGGNISSVAGSGIRGYSGDGGLAVYARLDSPSGIATDANGRLFIADRDNHRIRLVSPTPVFTVVGGGGVSLNTSGGSGAAALGYASIQPDDQEMPPSGLAIFGFRREGILVSEASVPASVAIQSGRIYAELSGSVNTGLALANPNQGPATISFFFTDSEGNEIGSGSTILPAGEQLARFLDEAPFHGEAALAGSFSFTSSVPIAAVALRGVTNERSEFLFSTLPIAPLTLPSLSPAILPHFAAGRGWSTDIVLVNPTDSVLAGTVQFLNRFGLEPVVQVDGQQSASVGYSVAARSSRKLAVRFSSSLGALGLSESVLTGSVRVTPADGQPVPSTLAILSFDNGETRVAEVGMPAIRPGTAFKLYVEAAGTFGLVGSIQSGLAVTNVSDIPTTVTLELNRLDGSPVGLTGTLRVGPKGQEVGFLGEIDGFESLEMPFQGVVGVSSPDPISVIGLRGRYNVQRAW